MNFRLIKILALIFFSALSAVSLTSLVIFSLFNQLIADDVSYFRYFQDGTPWNFLYWHYFEHSGRFLQSVFIALGYTFFGDNSVKVMPILVLLSLIASTSWAFYRFIPWRSKALTYSILTGILVSSTAVLLMPSTYDSYLWWTSSSIYLTSIVALVINICIVDILVKKSHSKVGGWLLLIPLTLGQTLSEITAIVMAASAGLLLAYYLIRRNRERIIIFSKVLGALITGFFLTYFSPGSITRRTSEDGSSLGFEFMRIFVLSTRHAFELIASLSVWEFALLAAIGIFIGLLIKRLTRKNTKRSLLVIGLVILIGVYGSFCINNYVWYNMPFRAYTLPSFTLTVSIIAFFAVITNHVYYRYQRKFFTNILISIIVIACGSIAFTGMIRYSNSFAAFMITRDAAYNIREEAIEQRLKTSGGTVAVESLPILVKSEATDLIYGADKQIHWYEGALKGHNHIPGQTKVNVLPPPESYCTFGKTDQGVCAPRGDNTTFRKLLNKINNFMVYYFLLGY